MVMQLFSWGMKKRFVEVTFKKDGSTQIEGHNFKGVACEEATSFLEKLLGSVSGKRKHKAERWHKDQQTIQRH